MSARRGERQRLYVRPLDRFEATELAGTEGASMPFFAPDGLWVGFFASGKLQKVSVDGGAPVTLCDAPRGRGGDWGPDDSIIFAPDGNTGLSQIAAAGGTPRILTTLNVEKDEVSHRAPQFLPGGKTVLFTVFTGQQLAPDNRALSLVTGQTRRLVDSHSWARYVPDGHLIYVLNGAAVTAPFDPIRLTVTGPPTPVIEDLRPSTVEAANLWPFAVSAEGSLVFIPGGAKRRSLVSFDRHGIGTPLKSGLHAYDHLRLSPDGQRLALTLQELAGYNIWIYELAHDRLTPLTTDGKSGFPVWSPDGTAHCVRVTAIRPGQHVRAGRRWERPHRAVGDERLGPEAQLVVAGWTDAEFYSRRPDAGSWTLFFEQPPTVRAMVQLPGYQTQLPNLAGWPVASVPVGGIWAVRSLCDELSAWRRQVARCPRGEESTQFGRRAVVSCFI